MLVYTLNHVYPPRANHVQRLQAVVTSEAGQLSQLHVSRVCQILPVKVQPYWSGTFPPHEPSQPCTSACAKVTTESYLPHTTPSHIACSESAEHQVTEQMILIRSPVVPFFLDGASRRSSGHLFCHFTCSLMQSCSEHIELVSA